MINPVIIDNYDSFTYNLRALIFSSIKVYADIIKNDDPKCLDLEGFSHILISPGPGLPATSGMLMKCIEKYYGVKPILGICLGLQALAEHNAYQLIRLNQVCHGLRSEITITHDSVILHGITDSFSVGRYHSWAVVDEYHPSDFIITSVDHLGTIMSMEDRNNAAFGLQFHPESYMTEHAEKIMSNFFTFGNENQLVY